jgi:CBS-domain-containing membrane protein
VLRASSRVVDESVSTYQEVWKIFRDDISCLLRRASVMILAVKSLRRKASRTMLSSIVVAMVIDVPLVALRARENKTARRVDAGP